MRTAAIAALLAVPLLLAPINQKRGDDTADPVGACCTPSACIDGMTEAVCVLEGKIPDGYWSGEGTVCGQTNVCGACCETGANNCIYQPKDDCTLGTYYDNQLCSATSCALGVCCDGANCDDNSGTMHEEACANTFQPGVPDCVTNTCDVEPTGACCDGITCTPGLTATECAPGDWLGAGVPCTADICSTGSCCEADFTCDTVRAMDCASGHWTLGGTCATECGSCCTPAGAPNTCTYTEPNDCSINLLGDFVAGEVCNVGDPCNINPPVIGACCSGIGQCNVVDESLCATGDFAGEGTTCDFGTCGSCCQDNEDCDYLTQTSCDALTNSWWDASFDCSNAQCTIGSCCDGDGTHPTNCIASDVPGEKMYEGRCNGVNDTFDAGGTCATSPCEKGACCLSAGGCGDDYDRQECQAPDSFVVGDTCAGGACDVVGACCGDNGCADNVTQAACEAGDGFYNGDATTCATENCQACCQSGSCTNQDTPSICSGGVIFPDEGCGTVDCTEGACCTPTGCVPDQIESVCEGVVDQHWSGAATVCADPDVCGGCCTGGNCTYVDGDATCAGEYYDDTLCSALSCTLGTCCDGAACTDTTPGGADMHEEACANSFQAGDADCGTNACAVDCSPPSDIALIFNGEGCGTFPCDSSDTTYTFDAEDEYPVNHVATWNGGNIQITSTTPIGTGPGVTFGTTRVNDDNLNFGSVLTDGQDYCVFAVVRANTGVGQHRLGIGSPATNATYQWFTQGTTSTWSMAIRIAGATQSRTLTANLDTNESQALYSTALTNIGGGGCTYAAFVNGNQVSTALSGRECFDLSSPTVAIGSNGNGGTTDPGTNYLDSVFISVGTDAACRCGFGGCSGGKRPFQTIVVTDGYDTCSEWTTNSEP